MRTNTLLEKLIERYKSILLAKQHLGNLIPRLEKSYQDLEQLTVILNGEYNDIVQLEKLSLKGLFLSILKTKEKQLELENQEYLEAVLQYRDLKKSIDLLQFEREILEEKVAEEEKVKLQLTHLLAQRDLEVEQQYAPIKREMIDLNSKLDSEISYKRELHEALIVGMKVKEAFHALSVLLQKEFTHKTWHMNSDLDPVKVDNNTQFMDHAQFLSIRIKILLEEFEDELEDIHKHKAFKFYSRMEVFRHFKSIYNDYIISDWILQSNINSTLHHVAGTRNNLERVLVSLKVQLKQVEYHIGQLLNRKQSLIEDYLQKFSVE